MQWIDSPPCTALDVKVSDGDVLELAGPKLAQRVASGIATAFGATFALAGLAFLRVPFPMPFRLIPLLHTAVGTAVGGVGLLGATAQCSVRAERRRGVTIRWRTSVTKPRQEFVAAKDIAAFEITAHTRRVGDDRFDRYVTDYRLLLVRRDGEALPLECFDTMTQAELRRESFERVLWQRRVKGKKRRAA